jgi:hypothetical protein
MQLPNFADVAGLFAPRALGSFAAKSTPAHVPYQQTSSVCLFSTSLLTARADAAPRCPPLLLALLLSLLLSLLLLPMQQMDSSAPTLQRSGSKMPHVPSFNDFCSCKCV